MTSVNVYFQPDVIENSRSWVIYKLMPDGEIVRMYEIGRSGRIYLHGKPGEFRVTQPDYPTVFMDDDQLCKLKHDWLRRHFVVDTNPSAELVAAARARQMARKQSALTRGFASTDSSRHCCPIPGRPCAEEISRYSNRFLLITRLRVKAVSNLLRETAGSQFLGRQSR